MIDLKKLSHEELIALSDQIDSELEWRKNQAYLQRQNLHADLHNSYLDKATSYTAQKHEADRQASKPLNAQIADIQAAIQNQSFITAKITFKQMQGLPITASEQKELDRLVALNNEYARLRKLQGESRHAYA